VPKRRKSFLGKYSRPKQGVDFPLILATLAILLFGLIMVLTAGSVRSFNTTANQNSFFYVIQQLKWALFGGVVALIMANLPYKIWRRFSGVAIVVSIALLVAVLFTSAGLVAKGSARWLKIGPVNVQPPVRLTTFTGWPSSFSMRLPMMRAVASVPPPAPQGTISWIGREG
jgi:cell division protein FtsW